MKAKITEKGLTLEKKWFDGYVEVEIVKTGSSVVIAPVVAPTEADLVGSRPDDPIWSLGRNPIKSDPLTDGSARHDEIIYQGR